MDLLTEKYISDEETDEEDGQGLVHRTLTWRAPKLNMLILKWDKRYNKKKDDLRPLKPRRDGEPSTRPIPKNPLSWAICSVDSDSAAADADGSENTEREMDSSVPLSEEHNSTEMTPINSDSSFAASQSSGDDIDSDDDPELDRWLQRATGLH